MDFILLLVLVVFVLLVLLVLTTNRKFPPVFESVSVIVQNQNEMSGSATVTSNSTLTSAGMVYSTDPNLADPITLTADISGNSFTFSRNFSSGFGTYYYKLFAANSTGTTYYPEGEPDTFTAGICLLEGTLITLKDGSTKLIENIDYSDELLTWNFDRGEFSSAKPLWIKIPEIGMGYNILKFSNGSTLRTFLQHRIFNSEKGMFTHPMTEDTPIGTTTFSLHGPTTLVNKAKIYGKKIRTYNIITQGDINLFANGILTSCRYNNIYPIENMKFVKDQRVLRTFDQYTGVEKFMFDGLRLSESLIPVDETIEYLKYRVQIMKPQGIMFLDHHGVMAKADSRTVFDDKTTVLNFPSFDTQAVELINQFLTSNPHYQIVVSSDWKNLATLNEMKQFYIKQGIIRGPIDFTPRITGDKDYSIIRTDEIKEWLSLNFPDSNNYIVLDDLELKLPSSNFKRIDSQAGLIEPITILF